MLNGKLSAVIVDDEVRNIGALNEILISNCPEIAVVGKYENPLEAVDFIYKLRPDIVFLDISMPEFSGFEFLNQFEKIWFKIIFTTAYGEYAIKAIKYAAFDYLLKPINPKELIETINKIKDASDQQDTPILQHKGSNTNLALPTPEGFSFIDIFDIIYCRSDNSYTDFILKEGNRIMVSRSLSETSEMLEKYDFFRIHQSFLVNAQYIRKYNKHNNSIIVSNGDELPISLRKKDEFFRFIAKL